MDRYTRTLPGRPESARAARQFTAECLAGCPAADDAVLCVDELVANSVQHSRSGLPGGTLTLRITVERGEWLRIEVEDAGALAAAAGPASRGLLEEGGRGLALIVALSEIFAADAALGSRWFSMRWTPEPLHLVPRPRGGMPAELCPAAGAQ